VIGYYEFRDCPTCGKSLGFLTRKDKIYCDRACKVQAEMKARKRRDRERARA